MPAPQRAASAFAKESSVEATHPVERTLTRIDHVRLMRLIAQPRAIAGAEAMLEILDSSDLVASPSVPPTVVTMYTQVLLEDALVAGVPYKLTLCYPEHAEPREGFISVLSPVGRSLLGMRVGAVARWRTPGGTEGAARILSVLFQPEASGDYTT
jgi:regulator of nucleoside diphosphate kinase